MTAQSINLAVLILILTCSHLNSSIINVQSQNTQNISQEEVTPTATENSPNSKPTKFGLNMTYEDFKSTLAKTRKSDDKVDRKKEFNRNLANLKKSQCSPCGVTKYFDWTDEQMGNLKGKMSGKGDESKYNRLLFTTEDSAPVFIKGIAPSGYDWRDRGLVTPAKDQGQCGSCWAFATTAFFQSQLIRRGVPNYLDLSQQYLLKCDTSSYGCEGGYINTALKLAITKGMPLDYVYPYTATTFYTTTMCTDAFTLKHIFGSTPYTYFNTQQKMSDAGIINLLARGPVLATVCADDWFYYKPSPTQRTMSCSWWYSTSYSQINHAILIVGYTYTEWIIKNSWGAIWGLDGFIYVSRNQSYNCGIGFELYTIASPKPPSAY